LVSQESLEVRTAGRSTTELTGRVQAIVGRSGIVRGICNVFLMHTSASLILCENADPDVRADLERFMSRLAPDGDPLFTHDAEGADDMPAHVRSVLTTNSISIPVSDGQCLTGTWQGLYLWEHRQRPHVRTVAVTVFGE
jgi:secondary thiamine-phosphate synthase enzyme